METGPDDGMKAPKGRTALKAYLDLLYATYDHRYLHTSALKFPHRYSMFEDVEAVGFLASAFAYGRVEGFTPPLDALLEALGEHPYQAILHFDPHRDLERLRWFTYRFHTAKDLVCLLWFLRQVLERHSSLRAFFLRGYHQQQEDTREALASFIEGLLGLDPRPIYRKGALADGMHHLLPSPRLGGACKRLHLFLRWMVRRDHLDFGLWPEIEPGKLIMPVDTHVAQVSQKLGLTRLKTPGLAMALDITRSLRRFDPADPVKYDFALCRLGMLGEK